MHKNLNSNWHIMQDVHDGIGGQLVQALSIAAARPDLAPMEEPLRHCLDELRLMIDSIEPVDGDLASVLGTLRMRMSRRLAQAGISLRWQVEDLPPVPDLRPKEVLEITRIVQEAIANALKHSGSRSLRVVLGAVVVGLHELGLRGAGEAEAGGGCSAGAFPDRQVSAAAGSVGQDKRVAVGRGGDGDVGIVIDRRKDVVDVAGEAEIDDGSDAAAVCDANLAALGAGAHGVGRLGDGSARLVDAVGRRVRTQMRVQGTVRLAIIAAEVTACCGAPPKSEAPQTWAMRAHTRRAARNFAMVWN